MTLQQNNQITKEIYIECSPKTLFSFFIDPEKMMKWMGRHILLEPKIGGKYRIDINGQDIAIGEYKEITPFEKIIMSWGWNDSSIMPPGSTTLEFHLIPKNNGTLLKFIHSNIPEEKMPSNNKGWNHYMVRLKDFSEGKDIGIDPWSLSRN